LEAEPPVEPEENLGSRDTDDDDEGVSDAAAEEQAGETL
jgi:hypothetical protein